MHVYMDQAFQYAHKFWPSVCPSSVCLSENFNVGHNFCNIEDSNLIFGMHVYLMKLHIFEWWKVKVILQGQRSFFFFFFFFIAAQ